MAIKLEKKRLDEAIRLNRKYFNTSDVDVLPAYHKALNEAYPGGVAPAWFGDALTTVTLRREGHSEPNSTYYKVLEVLDCEVVDVMLIEEEC